jgi:uncharacterized protein YkwD
MRSRLLISPALAALCLGLAGCESGSLLPLAGSRPVMLSGSAELLRDEFRDDPAPVEPVARAVFDRINRDRASAGLKPLIWDARAADLASHYTRDQLRDGTYGHFLTDGVPPYRRLSRAGIFGFGAENAAAFSAIHGAIQQSPEKLAIQAHESMMREVPPDDGHRRAVLDPTATHVGIGWAADAREFRLDEEISTRAFRWIQIRPAGPRDTALQVRGQSLPGEDLAFVAVAREPAPEALAKSDLQRRRSYSYPAPQATLIRAASGSVGTSLRDYRCLVQSLDGRFSFEFAFDQPGLWTFVFYFQGRNDLTPHPGGSITVPAAVS